MEVDINQIVASALVALVLILFRWLKRQRFWQRIATRAAVMLEDPSVPVDTPKDAVARALLEAQQPQLESAERRVTGELARLNGKHADK
jgi:hypothetical protein